MDSFKYSELGSGDRPRLASRRQSAGDQSFIHRRSDWADRRLGSDRRTIRIGPSQAALQTSAKLALPIPYSPLSPEPTIHLSQVKSIGVKIAIFLNQI